MSEAPFDAWLVGTHDLPPEARARGAALGQVVVHDKDADVWFVIELEDFERDYEWIGGP